MEQPAMHQKCFRTLFRTVVILEYPTLSPFPGSLIKKPPTKPQEIHNMIPILIVLCSLWKSLYYPHIFIWPNGEQENPFSLQPWCTRPGSSWAQGRKPSPKSICLSELCDPAQNPALAPPPLRLLSPALWGWHQLPKARLFLIKERMQSDPMEQTSAEGHSSRSQSLVASPPTS